jgi:hypothetical protein
MVGTSMATPLVTRIAVAVKARHPSFSANLVRALVLLSAQSLEFELLLEGAKPSKMAAAARNLAGFGQPALARAIESTSHRVVLVADGRVAINGVDIYELPLPTSFSVSGGRRGVDIALAFDPRTRQSRLDYLSNRIDFALVRGMSISEVMEVVARIEGDEDVELEDDSGEPGDDTEEAVARPPTFSELGSRVVKLVPSSRIRSAGANQLGRVEFRTRLDPEVNSPMYLVVRNVNRWDDDSATQPYGLAVALWRDPGHPEVYSELEAELETVVEVPVEIEVEI